jgi:hypothetical protein
MIHTYLTRQKKVVKAKVVKAKEVKAKETGKQK